MPEDPPPDGAQLVSQAVADFVAVGQPLVLEEAGGAAHEVSRQIPVYGLGIPDPHSDSTEVLKRAKRFSWRYLVLNADGPTVADIREGADPHPVLDLAPGLAARIVEAGRLAEKAVGDDPGYEMRLLDFPVIGTSFLWAANPDPVRPDRLFSLDDEPAEVDISSTLERVSEAERQKGTAYLSGTAESGG